MTTPTPPNVVVDAAAAPTPPTPPPSMRSEVASGVRWGTFNQLVQQVVRLVVQVVLTRLLAPEAFGLLTLAFVVVNLGALLSGLGFSQALIQRRDLDRRLTDAVFVGSGLLGVALAAIVAGAAGPLAALLGDPAVAPLLRVLGLVYVFQGVEGVPNSLLRRALRFRPYVLSSTIAVVVGGVVGVGMGVAGAGVWALVGFALTESVVATVLAWGFAVRAGIWRPHVTWDLRPLRSVLGYSGAVTANRMLLYGSRNVDNLIVGRVLGATALGFYGLAYRVMLFPIQRAADVIIGVTLPAFAQIQDDPARLRTAYLRAVRFLAAVIVPVTVGVAVVADPLVPVVFGDAWLPAVTPLRILALSGPALAMTRLMGNLWEAMGRAGLSFAMSVLTFAALVPAFLIGVNWGVVGVSLAFTSVAYAGMVPALVVQARTTPVGIPDQLRSVAPVVAATAAMVAAVLAIDATAGAMADPVRLLAMVAAGASAFALTLWATDRTLVADALQVLRPGRQP